MPKRRRAWASWNFPALQREASACNDVSVTYWMNPLQGISDDKPLFVSLNPPIEPDPALTFGKFMVEHPQYNVAAFAAQKRLGEIKAGGIPGSAAPRPDTVFTRTDCAPALRSRKRWAPRYPGVHRRPNWPRPRSSDAHRRGPNRNS